MRSQFECDVTWFGLCLVVRSSARFGCYSIVCLRYGGVGLILDVQSQGGETISDVDGQEVGGS